MTTQTKANEVDQLMSMRSEAEAYANGAWDCEVAYVCEGGTEDSERFFDLTVPGNTVPSGLLTNLQQRGYNIAGIVSTDSGIQITAAPDT